MQHPPTFFWVVKDGQMDNLDIPTDSLERPEDASLLEKKWLSFSICRCHTMATHFILMFAPFFSMNEAFYHTHALVPKWYIKRRNSSKKTRNLFSSRRLITKSQYLGCANVHSKEKEKKKEKETEIIINYSQGEPDNSPIVWTDGSEPLPLAILTNTNSE